MRNDCRKFKIIHKFYGNVPSALKSEGYNTTASVWQVF